MLKRYILEQPAEAHPVRGITVVPLDERIAVKACTGTDKLVVAL